MRASSQQLRRPSSAAGSRRAQLGSVVPGSRRAALVRASQPMGVDAGCPWASMRAAGAAAVLSATLLLSPSALAVGLESIELPPMPTANLSGLSEAQRSKLAAVDEAFEGSETLRRLREKSAANAAKNAKEIANKYCARQAELGIGDCGGLNMIPGLTKNGKQKTPELLQKLLGVKVPETPDITLEELLARDFKAAEAGAGEAAP